MNPRPPWIVSISCSTSLAKVPPTIRPVQVALPLGTDKRYPSESPAAPAGSWHWAYRHIVRGHAGRHTTQGYIAAAKSLQLH